MIGALALRPDPRTAAAEATSDALGGFVSGRPIVVVSHFDADGLSAAAVLVRALERAGQASISLIVGKGETPWDWEVAVRIETLGPGGLIVADLGSRPEPVLSCCPTLVIDHHVSTGEPQGAITISGNGLAPEPTTALLAWWAAGSLGEQDDCCGSPRSACSATWRTEGTSPNRSKLNVAAGKRRCATPSR